MKPHTKIVIGIYKITSPTGKIYIGQSKDIVRRHRSYKNNYSAIKKQTKLYNSIQKYGWHKHKFEIIQECTEAELNKLEEYYIDLYQSFNSQNGLNLKSGGIKPTYSKESIQKRVQKMTGKKWTEDRRAAVSKRMKGKKPSEMAYLKLLESIKGKKQSAEQIKKRVDSIRKSGGYNWTEERKRLFSESKKGTPSPIKGKKMPSFSKSKMGAKNPCAIKVIDNLSGKIFDTIKDAADYLNIKKGTLAQYLRGSRKNKTTMMYL